MEKNDCQWLCHLLCDFLDGDAAEKCCSQIEEHLSTCENCRIIVKTLKTTMHMCKNHAHEDVPESVSIRVRQVVRKRLIEERFIEE